MNNTTKILLLVALILYIVSPVDLAFGPIDDAILTVAYMMYTKRTSSIQG